MSITKAVISTLLALLLTACMGVKFTYNNLDWFLPWYLDDYLLLDDQQEQIFEQHLAVIWDWHRYQELPAYSHLLNEIINDLDKQQITLERLHYYSDKTEFFYQNIINKALSEGSSFIANLNDKQLADMFDAIKQADNEFKEYVAENDLQERTKERQRSVSKTFRKWIGALSEAQKQRITQWSKEAETTLEYHIEYVRKSRATFENILSNRKNQALTKQRIEEFTEKPELLRSADYNNTIKRNDRRFRNLIIDIINDLSQKQRLRLRNKLLNYADDFEQLSTKVRERH